MILLICQVVFAGICIIGIPAGVWNAIKKNGNLKAELDPHKKNLRQRRLPPDNHSAAFFDGFITSEVLDHLDDMFK